MKILNVEPGHNILMIDECEAEKIISMNEDEKRALANRINECVEYLEIKSVVCNQVEMLNQKMQEEKMIQNVYNIYGHKVFFDQDKRLIVSNKCVAWDVYHNGRENMYTWCDMYGNKHVSKGFINLLKSSVRIYNSYHKKYNPSVPPIRLIKS